MTDPAGVETLPGRVGGRGGGGVRGERGGGAGPGLVVPRGPPPLALQQQEVYHLLRVVTLHKYIYC